MLTTARMRSHANLMSAASKEMFRSTGLNNAYRITATATSNPICKSSPEKPNRNKDSLAMMFLAVAAASAGTTSLDLTKSSAKMPATMMYRYSTPQVLA